MCGPGPCSESLPAQENHLGVEWLSDSRLESLSQLFIPRSRKIHSCLLLSNQSLTLLTRRKKKKTKKNKRNKQKKPTLGNRGLCLYCAGCFFEAVRTAIHMGREVGVSCIWTQTGCGFSLWRRKFILVFLNLLFVVGDLIKLKPQMFLASYNCAFREHHVNMG